MQRSWDRLVYIGRLFRDYRNVFNDVISRQSDIAAIHGSWKKIDDRKKSYRFSRTHRFRSLKFLENPLHIAVKVGDEKMVAKLLQQSPELALELDHEGNTALHLACHTGRVAIVRLLIESDSQLCLVKDRHERTPLHTAAMKGRVGVIEELLRACPDSVSEVSSTDETPFHAAVRHWQEKVLDLLLDSIHERSDYGDIINKKDCSGNTVLHLAVSRRHLKIINLLLTERPNCVAKVDVNAMNDGGFTAVDILDVLPHDGKRDMEIEKILQREGALRARDLGKSMFESNNCESCNESQSNWDQSSHLQANWPMKTKHKISRDAYHALLITTAVFLGITFHAALNAPGGKLVDNIKFKSRSSLGFQVGKQSSILLRLFIWFDSIAFITSAATMIIILMHEIPLKPWMLISVFSLYGAYICSIMAVSPGDALPVFLLGSPPILLAAMSKHLALHSTLLKLLQGLWIRVHKS
ncbi:hypothetical protein JRO89_XS11G0131000 [Xanthoceras sorbifolium]|uniref:PGG domain-containing protein n=1 Tax=Xanthoceras sorbifolium TaxID=99658 RepID=A0ABQ8HFF4_9ROSI|nr:hypothetical protein JRO89_XS11G0131000 [Xanthoceras sorbifolium]